MFTQEAIDAVNKIDKRVLSSNILFGSIYGGIFGVGNTSVVFAIFTLVSTN